MIAVAEHILPQTWGQLMFMLAVILVLELRHYAGLLRELFRALVERKVRDLRDDLPEEERARRLAERERRSSNGNSSGRIVLADLVEEDKEE